MQVVWAGLVVVVQPSASAGPPRAALLWRGPLADDDLVLHQVAAWLAGLRQGVQAAPPLPAFTPPPVRSDPAPEGSEALLPGFYL